MPKKKFVRKKRAKNVDEIDARGNIFQVKIAPFCDKNFFVTKKAILRSKIFE
jgi:hypothetical protein